jgi:hypothetical protein
MKEALDKALEALEDFADAIKYEHEQYDIGRKACCDELSYSQHSKNCNAIKAITAIKRARSAFVQEPVAEYRGVSNDGHYIIKPMQPLKSGALFYTSPPATQPAPVCHACESIEWEGKPCQLCQPIQPEQEPSQWRDMVVVSLVREGINKHKARELAEHFWRNDANGRSQT